MAEATVVRTTDEAMQAALIPLLEQYNPDRADASGIMAPFIEGPPGIGKTEVLIQLAKKLGIQKLIMISCGVIDTNLEFIGLPDIIRTKVPGNQNPAACVKQLDTETGESKILEVGEVEKVITKWIKPDRLAEFDTLQDNERGLLAFDDTHFLLERQQAMLMQLLTNNRTIHTHKVGNGANVGVIFLANGMEDNAGALGMLAPVIDRVKRIVIDLDAKKQSKAWVNWALDEGLHDAVVSFIQKEPDFLYTFNETRATGMDEQQKFASPRGWANFGREMLNLEVIRNGGKGFENTIYKSFPNASPEIKKEFASLADQFLEKTLSNYAAGTVGTKAASAFSAYYRIFRKYDLERFLKNPADVQGIAKEELMTASYRFGVSIARELIKLDEDMYNNLVVYVAKNMDKIRSVENRKETPIYADVEKYGANLETFATAPKELKQKIQDFCGAMLFLSSNKLITPPTTVINELSVEVSEGKLAVENLEEKLRTKLKGTLSAIGKDGLEERLIEILGFMGRFQKHLLDVEKEKRALNVSTFFGAFIGEISRHSKKDGVSSLSFRNDHRIEHDVLNLFLNAMLKRHPEFGELFSYRQTADKLLGATETSSAAPAKKRASKEL